MKCGHLFNGIGGFALAAHWMGWENVMHCEIDSFCNKVMNYHFPNSFQHEDIKTTNFTIWRGKLDLIAGGFPCQPYSTAGKRKGKDDDRHLWPEMLRAIREIQPGWIVGENVRGLTNWNGGVVFDEVQANLETEGYEVLPFLLPACGINADHRRDRIWFIAHDNNSEQIGKSRRNEGESQEKRLSERNEIQQYNEPDSIWIDSNNRSIRTEGDVKKEIQALKELQRGEDGRIYAYFGDGRELSTPVLCRSYNGIPNGMDRVRALGNAIVPQVAFQIFKAIEQYEKNIMGI